MKLWILRSRIAHLAQSMLHGHVKVDQQHECGYISEHLNNRVNVANDHN